MDEETIITAFRAALRGLRLKAEATQGDDANRFARWRDRYLQRLREAKTLALARAVVCELLAEGSVMLGGIDTLAGEDRAMAFWRVLQEDWRHVRDLALFALGAGEIPETPVEDDAP